MKTNPTMYPLLRNKLKKKKKTHYSWKPWQFSSEHVLDVKLIMPMDTLRQLSSKETTGKDKVIRQKSYLRQTMALSSLPSKGYWKTGSLATTFSTHINCYQREYRKWWKKIQNTFNYVIAQLDKTFSKNRVWFARHYSLHWITMKGHALDTPTRRENYDIE